MINLDGSLPLFAGQAVASANHWPTWSYPRLLAPDCSANTLRLDLQGVCSTANARSSRGNDVASLPVTVGVRVRRATVKSCGLPCAWRPYEAHSEAGPVLD